MVLGLSIGVFPGLGGIAGLSMLLPFVYGMDPVAGLAMMVGLVAVIPTSDTFASVLMGIPGSSASQATVLDGFPLAKQGQAARALSAAFTSSLFGGLFGAVVLTFFILIARPIVLAFGLPELLMLTILGLSMVGVLAGRSLLKGLVAAGLGMMVGAVGEAPAQGSSRMDFGAWYMQDGLSLVIVGLGIFAVPEIISLLRQDRAIARDARLGAGWWTASGTGGSTVAVAALRRDRRAGRRRARARRLGGRLDQLRAHGADHARPRELRQGRHPRRDRA